MKNGLGLLTFCGGCAELSYQELRDLGPFYLSSSTGNLGSPRPINLQNGGLSFFRRKIEPINTHKMASYPMDMNIIFKENMCLTDPYYYKHAIMMISWLRFNTGKNRHCFGWRATGT